MRLRRLSAFAAIVALAAACTPAATVGPTTGPSTGGTASAGPTANPFAGTTVNVVKAGDHAVDDTTIGHWIDALKTDYGITINLNATDSAETSLRAVVSGSADAAVAMSLTGLVSLVQQSSTDVKLVAADTFASDYQIVSKASITGVSDLTGKTEGISAPGDASELASHLCLNNQNFDYSSLKIVRIGGTSARIAALLAGQIDIGAAHIADALAGVAKSNGALKILLDCGKVVGNYPVTGLVLSGAYISAHKDLVQVLVNEYVNAMRWAYDNKDQFLTEAAAWVPDSDPADNMTSYDYFKTVGFWPLNGGIDLPSVETYLGYAAQLDVLTGKIPTTDTWVDDEFVTNYLAANGSR
ncbi:MAG TPA: ABC transporter substrate-binding protein [Candidatus Limnocylindrales bacterium]|jgi:ABC-type nitrate/sulfonate/bicarbonate transport system substrate-binding protein